MNDLVGLSNLRRYILDPMSRCIGKTLENYCYYDVLEEEFVTTNNNGIDITAFQLELRFENAEPVFVSWENLEGWLQYSLCVSEKSFCNDVQKFVKRDENWKRLVGRRLKSFEVYGFIKNKSYPTTYYHEPHLLILKFDNDQVLGIGNFYMEEDFVPKFSFGDDIWIIFGWTSLKFCIDKLALERLN